MGRPDEWTYQDLVVLYRDFPVKTTEEVAKSLGRSKHATAVKAVRLGLKKRHYGIVWTPQMLKLLKDFFPIMFNYALAKWVGVSQRSLIRKARELGLEKVPEFRERKRDDIALLISDGQKRCKKNIGRFQKGVHYNPDKEFKPGHTLSPESRAKQSASLKASWVKRRQQTRI